VAQVNLTVGNVFCSVGQDIEIPITVSNLSAANEIKFTIPYSSNLIFINSLSTSATLSSGASIQTNALANGKTAFQLELKRASAMSGSGTLVRLNAKCTGTGTANQGLQFQNVTVNGVAPAVTLGTGSVTVMSGTPLKVWIDPKGRVNSSEYVIELKMSKPDGWGIYSFRTELSFPSNAIRALSVDQEQTLSNGMFVAFNNNNSGRVIISAANTQPLSGTTQRLLRIKVELLPGVNSTSIPIEFISFAIDNGFPKADLSNAQWNFSLPVSINSDDANIPDRFELGNAYPNPFNPTTVIPFTLVTSDFVRMTVTDSVGRIVKTLSHGFLTAGSHEIVFDGSGLNSGVYMIQMNVNGVSVSQKITLIK
jgi:hypothetical protein